MSIVWIFFGASIIRDIMTRHGLKISNRWYFVDVAHKSASSCLLCKILFRGALPLARSTAAVLRLFV